LGITQIDHFYHCIINITEYIAAISHSKIFLKKVIATQLFQKLPLFIEPEDSLPQRPDTGYCPEAFESSPYFQNLDIKDSFHLWLDLSRDVFP
jgi:hypothetical protein